MNSFELETVSGFLSKIQATYFIAVSYNLFGRYAIFNWKINFLEAGDESFKLTSCFFYLYSSFDWAGYEFLKENG